MKTHTLYFLPLLLALVVSSCSKVSEEIQRDAIILDSVDYTIPVMTEVDSAYAFTGIQLPLNPGAKIGQLQGFTEANIKSIKLSRMAIVLKYLPNTDSIDVANHFGNFQSLRFSIPNGATPLNIASATISSASVNGAINLITNSSMELKPLLGANAATGTLTARTRTATTKPIFVTIYAWFTVTVSK